MLRRLYLEGFVQFSGVQFSPKLVGYLTDESNFKDGPSGEEIHRLNSEMLRELHSGLPLDLKEATKELQFHCSVSLCKTGFSLAPHRDFYDTKSAILKLDEAIAVGVLWLCPFPFTGREFVFGKILDTETDHTSKLGSWDASNLQVLGEIVPQTGLGVMIDLINPMWWHGVREMIAGGPVVAISINFS